MNKRYVESIKRVAKFFPVFPVVKGKKIPQIKGWQDKATQDLNQIEEWWSEWPTAYVGMPTGSKSGIWVVDIDLKDGKSGEESLKQYEALPSTFLQTTRSGGKHLFFKYEDEWNFKGSTDTLGRLVDTRADGNFVVTWPTPGYKFEGKLSAIASTPSWLSQFMTTRRTCTTTEQSSLTVPDRVFSESEVNKLLRDLDITEYRDRDKWRNIIMSVKAATDGSQYGFDALMTWSLEDEAQFGGDEIHNALNTVWESVDTHRDGGITAGTLVMAARKSELAKKAEAGFTELDVSFDWDTDKSGQLLSTETNMLLMLTREKLLLHGDVAPTDNPYFGLIVYNELKESVVFTREPPWAVGSVAYVDKIVEEHDLNELRLSIANNIHVHFTKAKSKDMINTAAHRSPCNPVLGYLDSLEWDGTPRIDEWIIKYIGAEDSVYTRAVSRRTLIAGVARAYRPGCKVDNILVLESSQGVGKSTVVEILGGEWAGAPEFPIGDKDAEQNLQGLWVVEWSELATSWKKEAAAIKSFLTKSTNRFRGSYGEQTRDWPRRCIIIGTHNPRADGEWLLDETGNRRYWPVRVTGINAGVDGVRLADFEGLASVRDQLWAEAKSYFQSGERWHLTPAENAIALAEQENRLVKDPRADIILDAVTTGHLSAEQHLSVNEVAIRVFEYRERDITKLVKSELGGMLRDIGWEARQKWHDGRNQLRFFRPDEEDELE